jgi:hypothetical protein
MSAPKQNLNVAGLYNKQSTIIADIPDTITAEQRIKVIHRNPCNDTCRVACPVCQVTQGKLCDTCMAEHKYLGGAKI